MEEITPKEIVEFMHDVREKKDHHFILFLGARAGVFFENKALYTLVGKLSAVTFETLDSEKKFQNCYQMLEEHFKERDRDQVLNQFLHNNQDYRLEDDYLGELIRVGFFDAVISTNIDLLLEDALRHENVLGERDYQVHIYGKTATKDITSAESGFVLKIFGDLESKLYKTAGDEFHIEEDPELRDFLENMLANHVLMLGYDPEWDKPMDEAFFIKGGKLIYVNDIEPDPLIARALEKRNGKCLVGKQGAYQSFMRNLYAQFFERGAFSYEAMRKVSRQLQDMREKSASQIQPIQEKLNALHSLHAEQSQRVQSELNTLRAENALQFQRVQEELNALREALERIEKKFESQGDID